jgi:hypothetical protein
MNHNFFLFKEPKSQRAASNALLACFSLSQLHSSAGNLPTVIASSYIDSFLALLARMVLNEPGEAATGEAT